MSPETLPFRSIDPHLMPAELRPELPYHARLIDREELARRLSVAVSTLDRFRAIGKVGPRAIKCGGVRFLLTEVVAWLSTPDRNGELYDMKTWPMIWDSIQRQRNY